jgi:N4-(beta-N-acetylglucosaminyl)-L-asparaginase
MNDNHVGETRRTFLSDAAGALAGVSLAAAAASAGAPQDAKDGQPHQPVARTQKLPEKGKFPIKAISSANGLGATKKAYLLILAGGDPLDAAIAGVNLVEDDPEENSVGLGGLPNEEGVVELDSAVMHGPTHRAGAVAAIRNIKNPSNVAKLVMDQTDHVLLVGEGALKFAKAQGFVEENLLTEASRKIWLYWKQSLSEEDDWLTPPDKDLDPAVRKHFHRPTGTIHCAAMNAAGDISCVTTTSGLAFKLPGRVGDSPIIGAGLYVDNAIGSCGSTGRGEANLQNLCSFAGVELMRGGMTPREAGLEILRRVAAHTVPRLRDKQGRPNFDLKFYLMSKDGRHAGVSMWGPMKFAVTDKDGTRLEDCAALYQKEAAKG